MKNINKIMCGILAILMFSNGYTKALTREVLNNIGQYLKFACKFSLGKGHGGEDFKRSLWT